MMNLQSIKQLVVKGGISNRDIAYLSEMEDSTVQLNQINKILAVVRENAIDDETYFHAAAIIRTSDGRSYVSVNLQTGEAIDRFCAERNAINEALRDDRNSQISDVWFMGGVGYVGDYGEPIRAGEEGKRHSPCGSCLELIHEVSFDNPQAKIHMLPLNMGDLEMVYAKDNTALIVRPNEVVTRDIDMLFPHSVIRVSDENGEIVKQMREGLDYFSNPHDIAEISRLERVGTLMQLQVSFDSKDTYFFVKLNKYMAEELRRVCSKDTHNIRSAAVAIVRTEGGDMFVGNNVHSRIQASTPSSVFTAISNATSGLHNPHITNVWKMKIDFEHLPQSLEKFSKTSCVEVMTLRGDERERVKKFSTKDENNSPTAVVTIILPNNGSAQKSENLAGFVTIGISSLLPGGFSNPKSQA